MRYFYTAFHLNLAFSSLPQKDHAWIIDNCYWPILRLSQKYNISLGIEVSGYTLELINRYDTEFIQTLKILVKKKLVEILGSGYSQAIYPLIPFTANLYNLQIANDIYRHYLEVVPTIAYVNEQVYSQGLITLFCLAGYKAIIIDRLNSPIQKALIAKNNDIYNSLYSPRRTADRNGNELTVLWNDSIAFQKFQRYTQGIITFDEYWQFLFQDEHSHADSFFPLYGSDLEIFDYRPGTMSRFFTSSIEMNHIETIFTKLLESKNADIITPSKVLELFSQEKRRPLIEIASPAEPIVCKKQIKYNPTRWALTGRDDSIINGECYRLFEIMNDIEWLSKKKLSKKDWKTLANLWASDFRTNCTDEKFLAYYHELGAFSLHIKKLYQALFKLRSDLDIYIYNSEGLSLQPFQFHLRFSKGKFKNIAVDLKKKPLALQIESVTFYSDNTIKEISGRAIFPKSKITSERLTLGSSKKTLTLPQFEKCNVEGKIEFSTPSLSLHINMQKGGVIDKAIFHQVSHEPLFGTIPHGYYDNPKWSPDFFSGHFLAIDRDDTKITDLQKAIVFIPQNKDHFKVAFPIIIETETKIGLIRKYYYLYHDIPCFDLVYHFQLYHFDPVSFRLGIVTLFPLTFDLDSLFYACHNGGKDLECFDLKSSPNFYHGEAVNRAISAQTCIGNTQNRFIIGDKEKEIHIQQLSLSPKLCPMVQFERVLPSYFFRTEFSLTELDETRLKIWNGDIKIGFRYSALKSDNLKHDVSFCDNKNFRNVSYSTNYRIFSHYTAIEEER